MESTSSDAETCAALCSLSSAGATASTGGGDDESQQRRPQQQQQQQGTTSPLVPLAPASASATAVPESSPSNNAMGTLGIHGFLYVDHQQHQQQLLIQEQQQGDHCYETSSNQSSNKSTKVKAPPQCPKQHQLPMFLSSKCPHNTYNIWSMCPQTSRKDYSIK
jgi:hypothetical protein